MLLLRARETAMGYFRPSLTAHGLTEQQWRVLRALNEHSELTAAGLADATVILAPSMTRILRKLSADGLVISRRSERDQRQLRVRLTEKGRRLIATVGPVTEGKYRLIEERLHPDKLEQLYALLHDFIALDEHDKENGQ